MRVFEFASDQTYYYIVSEYISKGELFDEIIRRKYLSEEDGAYVIQQVLAATTYCHAKGVVHRDLKPENILIDTIAADGKINIKVIDFGTALFFTPESKLKETLGTPYYIAPEVLMGTYNEKCDAWSIGVILFVLLSGTAPFNGPTDEDILEAVKKGVFSFRSNVSTLIMLFIIYIGKVWEGISDVAKDLIKKLLTYDPAKRITVAEAYKHPWLQSKKFTSMDPEKAKDLITNISHFYVSMAIKSRSLRKNCSRQP